MKKFSKIFMIFCVLFSQFSGTLEVLAEELLNETNNTVEEESAITVTLDDEYNLNIKGNGNLNDDSNYDIYLTSNYKYNYDESEISGYNEEKINGEEFILGSIFNSEEGYSVSVEGIESTYNGEFSLIVEVVDVLTEEIYSATVTKIVNNEDVFDVLANDVLVEEDTYTVDLENKEVKFVPVVNLYSTIGTVVPNVLVNNKTLLEDGSFVVNYEGMLYGTYTYQFDVLVDEEVYTSRTVSVVYDSVDGDNLSANNDILTTINTKGVKFDKENAYVTGELSVVDFVSSINLNEYDVKVIGEENEVVTEGNVSNGMSLEISKDGLVLTYAIVIVGDVDSDGDVDQDDVAAIVDSILVDEMEEESYNASADVNFDGVVNIFDVTKTFDALTNGWDNEVLVDNETLLNPVLSSEVTEEVKIGDTVTVRFALNNFGQNMINGLFGQVEYDNTILNLDQLVLVSLDETLETTLEVRYDSETGKFVVFGDDYNSEDYLLEVTFTAVGASEEEYISISSLVASYAGEEVELSTDSVSMSFVVTYTSNVGGDEEETEEEENTLVNNVVNTPRVLSADSYLSDLIIKGIDFDFSPYTFSYNIKVGSDVNSLDLSAILSDYRATYAVYGNENFKAGENIVTVVVTAEDGSTHTYTLIVEKEESDEIEKDNDKDNVKEDKEESNISRTVIVVLIVLVIIGLIYLIFKDDEEDEKKKD